MRLHAESEENVPGTGKFAREEPVAHGVLDDCYVVALSSVIRFAYFAQSSHGFSERH